jgi:hypothetical protein
MTPGLGLESANRKQGLDVIPAGTTVELVMKIRAGNIGLESLCKRSSKGDAEGLDVEYTVRGGEYDGRKLFSFMLIDGTTAGHAKAAEITRALLRAIFEAVNGIDPNDNSPATVARRANATLSAFNGATFLATVEVEPGGQRPDGNGRFRDKNIIGKVLRVGDQGYRRLEQPPPMPIERSAPPAQPHAAAAAGGTPAVAGTAIARPSWAD